MPKNFSALSISSLTGLIFGYDIFISYKRLVADIYVDSLYAELKKLDLLCFRDREELPAGKPLKRSLQRALDRTKVLLIIATEQALHSEHIKDEILHFQGRKRNKRDIITINIRGTLDKADDPPWVDLKELTYLDEPGYGFGSDVPSSDVISGVVQNYRYRHRNNIARVVATTASLILLALGVITAWQGFRLKVQEKELAQSIEFLKTRRTALIAEEQIKRPSADWMHGIYLAAHSLKRLQSLAANPSIAAEALHEGVRLLPDSHLTTRTEPASVLKFNQSGTILGAATEPDSGGKSIVRLFDVKQNLQEIASLKVDGQVRTMDLSERSNFQVIVASKYRPGGNKLLGEDAVIVWSFNKDEPMVSRVPTNGPVWSVARNRNEALLAVAQESGYVTVWERWSDADPQKVASLKNNMRVRKVAFGSSNQIITVTSPTRTDENARIYWWDLDTQKIIRLSEFEGIPKIESGLVVDDDGAVFLATDPKMGEVTQLYTIPGRGSRWPRRMYQLSHSGQARSMSVGSFPNVYLATRNAWGGHVADVWNVTGKRKIARVTHDSKIKSVALSVNGRQIATSTEAGVLRISRIRLPSDGIRNVGTIVQRIAFNKNGQMLLTGLSGLKGTHLLQAWEQWAEGQPNLAWSKVGHTYGLTSLVVDPTNPGLLVTGGGDGRVALWKSSSGEHLRDVVSEGKVVYDLAVSPDGEQLSVAVKDGYVLIFRNWRNENPNLVDTLPHEGQVNAIAYDPKGSCLVTGTQDGGLTLWKVGKRYIRSSEHRLENGEPFDSIVFHPNGDSFITGGVPSACRIWYLADGGIVPGYLLKHEMRVRTLAIAPRGNFLATGSDDGLVRLWDLNRNELVLKLRHGPKVWAVAFSPNGKLLSSGSTDGSVLSMIWQPDDLLQFTEHRLNRRFSQDAWKKYFAGEPYQPIFPNLPSITTEH